MIYLDSAAVVKLASAEPETPALVAWLNARARAQLIASALVELEVPRALRRCAPAAIAAVPGILAMLYRFEINATVRAAAASFPDAALRSLDAIHLATAHQVADQIEAFVTYDVRLLGAARRAGLPVASPGAPAGA